MSGSGQLGGGTDWLHGGMATVLSNLQNSQTWGQNQLNNVFSPILQSAGNDIQYIAPDYMNYIQNSQGQGLANSIANYPNQVAQMGGNFLGNGQQLQSLAQGLLGGGAQQLGNQISAGVGQEQNAGGMFQGINQELAGNNVADISGKFFDALTGNTQPEYNASASALNPLLSGQGTPGIGNVAPTGNSIIGAQGMTPMLSMLMNPMQAIIGSQGNNAQSGALMGGGTPFLQSGGTTNLTQGLAQQGSNLFNQQALMNPAQAAGLAGNLAATNYADQAQKAESNALARGGGAGATVANGLQNQGMADFANQIAQGVSGAETGALQNQQQLQLQQQGLGEQAMNASGGLQNALLGTSGGLVGQSGNLANNLFLQGMGLAPTTQNAASNFLGQGTNLAQLQQQGYLGGIQNMTNLAAQQGQQALGLGGLQNNLASTYGGLTNQSMANQIGLLNDVMGAGTNVGQLGTGQFNALTGATNAGLNTGVNMGNLYNNMYQSYLNPLQYLAGQYGNIWNTSQQAQSGLFGGGAAASGAPNSLLGTLLGGAGGILGAIPGLAKMSSIRYKENVEDIPKKDIDAVSDLDPVQFDYKEKHRVHDGGKEYGLIAEQVEKVLPELVFHNESGEAEGVYYGKLIPLLLAKVQQLEKRIKELE